MRNYFITGLPRSRTAWLANLFTHGPSFCYHDAMSFSSTPDRLWHYMSAHQRQDIDYIGNSDSSLVLHVGDTMRYFPEAKWVMVVRDVNEAAESYWEQFQGNYHQKAPKSPEQTKDRFVVLQDALVNAMVRLPDALIVRYNEIGFERTIRQIWKHCLPDVPFDEARWRMLESFKVNVIPEKVVFSSCHSQ